MIPREVVTALSQHIIGQDAAKRAIAIALRNRWRRLQLRSDQQDEVIPKNILMVGPTGCGKTEIARRLAKLCKAPFVKVEATKFTEVGYHGKDVDSIIKDLLDAAMVLVKELKTAQYRAEVGPAVEAKLLLAMAGEGAHADTVESLRSLLREGAMEDREITVEVPVKEPGQGGKDGAAGPKGMGMGGLGDLDVSIAGMGSGGGAIDLGEFMSRVMPGARGKPRTEKRTLPIKEARAALEAAEIEARLASQDLRREAVALAEQNGIVVIDEIDKIISNKNRHSGDASSEGVQRDLLPLIEGTTVEVRRFGNVRTDYMLFIACGAFHEHKPSDLLAELQGRLPIRVELKGLEAADLERILSETKFSLLQQQAALLAAEGITVEFAPDAVKEIARLAAEVNRNVENIGARRLHTVIERIMEEISFSAPDLPKGSTVTIDKALVRSKLMPLLEKQDLSKFIL